MKESCGSLYAKPSAFSDFSDVRRDSLTIKARNSILFENLLSRGLRSIYVGSDGNCYFRVLCVCLYGRETEYCIHRKTIDQYIADNNRMAYVSTDSTQSDIKYIENISTPNTYVGEDVIKASADYLNRDVYVFSSILSSPFVYKPSLGILCRR